MLSMTNNMSAENGVEIRLGLPNKGKGLFATKSLKEGDVVFEEAPLVCAQFSWNAFYKYLACDHCLRSMETAEAMCQRLTENPSLQLPHSECCEVELLQHVRCPQCQLQYCSESCRQAAWNQYHRSLCLGQSTEDPNHPINKVLEVWRNLHFPPETCSIMLIAKIIATVKQSADKEQVLASFSQFCKTTVNEEEAIAHKLLGSEFQEQLDLLRNGCFEAFFDESVEQWFTPDGFKSLFALIGTNGQGIGTSSFAVWVRHCEELDVPEGSKQLDSLIDHLYEDLDRVSGQFLNCEGSGLYSLQSACNHSCTPNAEVTFPYGNSILAVKVLQNVKPGEEICISYLDSCELERSRHSRQKALRENYIFNCLCPKCESQTGDADETSEEEMEEEDEASDGGT